MRSRLMLWGRRVSSWFRQVVLPARTEAAEISEAAERPWLDEQMRTWASNVPRRWTPLSESITNETAEMRQAYREALAEPTVKAALLGKIGQVLFLDLQVVPENKKDPLEIEAAEFVRSQLIGPSGTFFDIGWPILSGGLVDGFSVSEKLPGTVERGRFAGRWGLRGLKSKDTQRLLLETDTYRNVTGIWSTLGNAGTFFDPNDFVVFSWLKFFENPTGMSDLRPVYRAVKMIVHAIKLRMIFLDKYTGPYLKGRYNDASRRAKLREALSSARSQGYIMLGPGDDVEVVDLAARGTADFQAAIDDLRKEVAIAITGSFLTMLEGSDPGVRGNSEVQKDTAEIFAELLVAHVVSCINTQLVPDLIIPNYGNRIAFPRVGLSAIDPAAVLKELEIDKLLQDMGADLSASEVYDRAGRSPPKDDADRLKKPQVQTSAPGGFPGLPSAFTESEAAEFSDEEVSQFARAGLVPKKITDKNGHQRTVWVKGSPDAPAEPKSPAAALPAPKQPARPTVDGTLAHVQGLRSNFSTEGLLALAQSLHGHTVAELKAIKDKLGVKASGRKAELAKKIAERALGGSTPEAKPTAAKQPARANRGESKISDLVSKSGLIDIGSLRDKAQMPKAEFDAELIAAAERGDIQLHVDETPGRYSKADLAKLVPTGDVDHMGNPEYYTAATPTAAKRPAKAATVTDPKSIASQLGSIDSQKADAILGQIGEAHDKLSRDQFANWVEGAIGYRPKGSKGTIRREAETFVNRLANSAAQTGAIGNG